MAGAASTQPDALYLIIEAGAAILILLAAVALSRLGGAFFRRIERLMGTLARRRALAVLLVGLAAPLLRLSILPWAPAPEPEHHDEFSYLLAADTFASGRLANPTPPMWTHFETFHESFTPTYMSMYPPMQGLMLAAGKVVFGHPWFGVVFCVGLMSAAICWMLQAWLPPRWALIGSLLAVLRIGITSYWMNSYLGGVLPAMGGAVALGALPRLIRRPRARYALLLGAGLAILANSRPFEGFLIGIPIAFALAAWMAGVKRFNPARYFRAGAARPPAPILFRRVLLPIAGVVLTVATAMGYYNWRVFGNPATLPYQINRATYAVAPVFLWESPYPEPSYRHPVMRDFYVSAELPEFERARGWSGFGKLAITKATSILFFFFGFVLVIPLVFLPWALRDRRTRFLFLAGAVFFAGLLASAFTAPHYAAPATGIWYAILAQCMRRMRLWKPGGEPAGLFLTRAVPALALALCVFHAAAAPLTSRAALARAAVERRLAALPGRQLAIVRYAPNHNPLALEWVYNTADIDSSPVVWARDMGPERNRELIDYFNSRQVWLIEPDYDPPKLARWRPEPQLSAYRIDR